MSVIINDFTQVFSGISMGASAASSPINMYKIEAFAVQVVWTGSPVGTITLESSCDKGSDMIGTGVTTWDPVSGASQATSGAAGSVTFNYTAKPGYNWLRVVYTRTSGTGVLSAKYNGKG